MKKILVFVEELNGKVKKSSEELLTKAQGSEIYACFTNKNSSVSEAFKDELKKWNLKSAIFCISEKYSPEVFFNFFVQAKEAAKPDLILATSNSSTRDFLPRIAAKFDCEYISDCIDFSISPLKIKRPMYSGKCYADVEIVDSSCAILLARPNQISIQAPSQASSSLELTEIKSEEGSRVRVIDIIESAEKSQDLSEANLIISGGRGLKEAANFKILKDMAAPIGAVVGASRAVVDLGWVPHSLQVGQTGKTVAPSLYIACGISGAIQHIAGMSESKVIVAINKDEKAPIFQKSTYGIVGDFFEVAPHLIEEFKKLANQ